MGGRFGSIPNGGTTATEGGGYIQRKGPIMARLTDDGYVVTYEDGTVTVDRERWHVFRNGELVVTLVSTVAVQRWFRENTGVRAHSASEEGFTIVGEDGAEW